MNKKLITILLSFLILISSSILVIDKFHKEEDNYDMGKEKIVSNDCKSGLNEFLKSYDNNNISLNSVSEMQDEYIIKLNIICKRNEFNIVIDKLKKYYINDFDFTVNNDIINGTVSIIYKND